MDSNRYYFKNVSSAQEAHEKMFSITNFHEMRVSATDLTSHLQVAVTKNDKSW